MPSPDADPCQGMRKHRVPRPSGTGKSTSEGVAGSDPACVKCLASLDGNERVKQTLAAREGRGDEASSGGTDHGPGGVCVPGGNIWWAGWARPPGRKRGIPRERSIGVSAHGHSTPPVAGCIAVGLQLAAVTAEPLVKDNGRATVWCGGMALTSPG